MRKHRKRNKTDVFQIWIRVDDVDVHLGYISGGVTLAYSSSLENCPQCITPILGYSAGL